MANLSPIKQRGFTLVELLIVIAILAAISIVAYNGIQQRARDAQRTQDIATIYKALEMYYAENNEYPPSGGATVINTAWSNSQDDSWNTLANHLRPYVSQLPKDPTNTTGQAAIYEAGIYNYSYYSSSGANYCYGTPKMRQMFIIGYRKEGVQSQQSVGECLDPRIGPYASSLRVVK